MKEARNLSRVFRSSSTVGTLVPFMTEIGLNGDKFDIDLNAMIRTIPTIAPLFGTFKLQLDVFEVPIRLYNGLLHNNAINIGLDMNKVKFPFITVEHNTSRNRQRPLDVQQIAPDSLLAYLGVRGLGTYEESQGDIVKRKFNAVPILAFYDIFKQYYANKQEDNAYVIGANTSTEANITITLNSIITIYFVHDVSCNISSTTKTNISNKTMSKIPNIIKSPKYQ